MSEREIKTKETENNKVLVVVCVSGMGIFFFLRNQWNGDLVVSLWLWLYFCFSLVFLFDVRFYWVAKAKTKTARMYNIIF